MARAPTTIDANILSDMEKGEKFDMFQCVDGRSSRTYQYVDCHCKMVNWKDGKFSSHLFSLAEWDSECRWSRYRRVLYTRGSLFEWDYLGLHKVSLASRA